MIQPALPEFALVTDRAGAPIPLDGAANVAFYTASGALVAKGYRRVV